MKSMLFVCVGNACRSQIAEGFAKAYGPKDLVVYSCGSRPAGFVASEAVETMKEKGIDISKQYSKGVDQIPLITFDYIVTMGCGDQACAYMPAKTRIDWQIPDPFGHGHDYFQKVRDEIEEKVRVVLKEIS